MVLEPFTALSLASTIVQFVDLGSKLVTQSSKIYHSTSGTSQDVIDLQAATIDLKKICKDLEQPYTARSYGDDGIVALAKLCSAEARKLSSILERHVGQPGVGKWRSFLHALQTELQKDKIEQLRSNLGLFQTQLILHLAVLTRLILNEQSDKQAGVAKELGDLSAMSARMNMNASAQLDHLKHSIEELKELVNKAMERHRASNEPTKAAEPTPSLVSKPSSSLMEARDGEVQERQRGYGYSLEDGHQLQAKMRDLIATGYSISIEHEIIRSLRFESITIRESNIAQAHKKTFNWIFETSASSKSNKYSQNQFLHWLRCTNGVFWISGKPGSGKSTLMKYLCNHANTTHSLRHWAGTRPLATGSYFFWSAGTEMQKSQQGLLQTLLYWVLRECPQLTEIACPSRWADIHGHKDAGNTLPPWTRDELLSSFDRLIEHNPSSTRFCFFIDGLDEYEGDHTEIVEILHKFSTSEHIKLCLSSRPWNVFKNAYGGDTSRFLRLQDLTRDDIGLYVRDRFQENDRFAMLKQTDSRYNSLVNEIIDKAEGVFLWVVLVVRSLREGITNADSVAILKKRLHELPSDLESFFRHILDQVDRVYREGTTQVFQLATAAVEPLPLMEYSVLDEEPDFALKLKPQQLSTVEVDQHCDILERRLNARCKGLMEVKVLSKYPNQFSKRKVEFLHRTVRDFLRLPDIQKMLAERLEQPFDTLVTLCNALLIYAKRVPEFEAHTLDYIMDDLTHYAQILEQVSKRPPTDPLDQLHELASRRLNTTQYPPLLHPLVLHKGLHLYVKKKLALKPELLYYTPESYKPSLLDAALMTLGVSSSKYDMCPNPELVQLLLDNNENPNYRIAGSVTTWTRFLRTIYTRNSTSDEMKDTWFKVIEILIMSGADCRALVILPGQAVSPVDIFDTVFKQEQSYALKQLWLSQGGSPKHSSITVESQKHPPKAAYSFTETSPLTYLNEPSIQSSVDHETSTNVKKKGSIALALQAFHPLKKRRPQTVQPSII